MFEDGALAHLPIREPNYLLFGATVYLFIVLNYFICKVGNHSNLINKCLD